MLKRILGLLGWLGVALVFAAVAIRFLSPEWQQWYNGLAIAGLVCTLLYILSQWREVARSFSGRQARFGIARGRQRRGRASAILVAINYLSTRHNKRWDLTAAKQFSLSDQTKKVLQGLQKPVHDPRVRPERGVRALPRAARRVSVRVEAGDGRVHRHGAQADAGEPVRGHRRPAPSSSTTTAAPSGSRPTASRS